VTYGKRARAQAIVWVAVMLPVIFIPVVGLSIDAGRLFDARREAQNVADGAARVGAMELDDTLLQQTGRPRIVENRARNQARAYAARSGYTISGFDFSSDGRSIRVAIETRVQPTFLRLARVGPVDVRAAGRARVCQGTQAEGACS
jgi:uncharacterized membrane protein